MTMRGRTNVQPVSGTFELRRQRHRGEGRPVAAGRPLPADLAARDREVERSPFGDARVSAEDRSAASLAIAVR
jgi:hypothetical protein